MIYSAHRRHRQLPAAARHDQRRSRAAGSTRATNGSASAPASRSATSPTRRRPRATSRSRRPQRARGGRRRAEDDRSDRRRDVDARLHLSEHRLPAAGEARRRRAAPRSTSRRCARGFVYALATADSFIRPDGTEGAGGRRRSVLAHPRLERPRHLRAVRRRRRRRGAGSVRKARRSSRAACTPTAAMPASCRSPGNVRAARSSASPFLQMDGQAVFKFAVRVLDEVARETLAAAGMHARGHRLADPAPGERAHPRGDRAQARAAAREAGGDGRPPRQHVCGVGAAGARRSRARRPRSSPATSVLMQGVGGGFTWGASSL